MLPPPLQAAFEKDYVIERELGGGGMSRVFVATERSLQRKVVIKVLPPELSGGVNIERFRREIQLAAQLQHPHIVPLLTASSDRDVLWFTMPFIEGSSLRRTLEKSQRLAPRDVVRILHDVVDALAYAHARGVVHRDIKPDNILTSGMHALVTDFGVAKALSAAIPAVVGTTTGMAIGTPAYMAPEQLAADPAADHRVDIYAVGLLAYELLTGKSPFSGASPQATLAAQLTLMPDAPHRAIPDIPEPLSAVVMRCLEKDASKRFQSAADMLAALDALPPMPGSGSIVAPAKPKRRWKAVAGVAALLVAAIALANTFDTSRGDADNRADTNTSRDSMRSDGEQATADARDTTALARIGGDNNRSTSVPVVITREESLAIAAAIQQRSQPRPSPTPPAPARGSAGGGSGSGTGAGTGAQGTTQTRVALAPGTAVRVIDQAMLLEEVQRIFRDSAVMAFARVDSTLANLPRVMRMEVPNPRVAMTGIAPLIGPPEEGTVRVVVTPFDGRGSIPDDLGRFGIDIADAVRGALSGITRVHVPDYGLTERARVNGDRMVAGWRLRADYVVNGAFVPRNDSISVVLQFTDVRTGRFTRAARFTVPREEPRQAFEPTARRVLAWLDTARVMPGRHTPRPPGVPLFPDRGPASGTTTPPPVE